MRVIMAANGYEHKFRSYLVLNGFQFSEMIGCYKGTFETSFNILITNNIAYQALLNKAREYNQESILLIDNADNASIIFTSDNTLINIGVWRQVTEKDAISQPAYSIDDTGTYYLAA